MSDKKLNPNITPVDVGIEELRTVKIYPLSIKDNTENLPQLIVNGYNALQEVLGTIDDFTQISTEKGTELLEAFKDILYDNLDALLELVVREEDRPKPEEITSNQLFTIIETIFIVNYEGVLKNSLDLYKRVKGLKNQ